MSRKGNAPLKHDVRKDDFQWRIQSSRRKSDWGVENGSTHEKQNMYTEGDKSNCTMVEVLTTSMTGVKKSHRNIDEREINPARYLAGKRTKNFEIETCQAVRTRDLG